MCVLGREGLRGTKASRKPESGHVALQNQTYLVSDMIHTRRKYRATHSLMAERECSPKTIGKKLYGRHIMGRDEVGCSLFFFRFDTSTAITSHRTSVNPNSNQSYYDHYELVAVATFELNVFIRYFENTRKW